MKYFLQDLRNEILVFFWVASSKPPLWLQGAITQILHRLYVFVIDAWAERKVNKNGSF